MHALLYLDKNRWFYCIFLIYWNLRVLLWDLRICRLLFLVSGGTLNLCQCRANVLTLKSAQGYLRSPSFLYCFSFDYFQSLIAVRLSGTTVLTNARLRSGISLIPASLETKIAHLPINFTAENIVKRMHMHSVNQVLGMSLATMNIMLALQLRNRGVIRIRGSPT